MTYKSLRQHHHPLTFVFLAFHKLSFPTTADDGSPVILCDFCETAAPSACLGHNWCSTDNIVQWMILQIYRFSSFFLLWSLWHQVERALEEMEALLDRSGPDYRQVQARYYHRHPLPIVIIVMTRSADGANVWVESSHWPDWFLVSNSDLKKPKREDSHWRLLFS